jgi:hypothetical protein
MVGWIEERFLPSPMIHKFATWIMSGPMGEQIGGMFESEGEARTFLTMSAELWLSSVST